MSHLTVTAGINCKKKDITFSEHLLWAGLLEMKKLMKETKGNLSWANFWPVLLKFDTQLINIFQRHSEHVKHCVFCSVCDLGGKMRFWDSIQINIRCLQKFQHRKLRLDCAVMRLSDCNQLVYAYFSRKAPTCCCILSLCFPFYIFVNSCRTCHTSFFKGIILHRMILVLGRWQV